MPPPFGSGYLPSPVPTNPTFHAGFNCAAPFRERLSGEPPGVLLTRLPGFQLCRPLSGAVMVASTDTCCCVDRFQLCRPLSGAVICLGCPTTCTPDTSFNCAAPFRERLSTMRRAYGQTAARVSIVPPPFGSGYRVSRSSLLSMRAVSIVPPPFGSGYMPRRNRRPSSTWGFNCAAPFRERLSQQQRQQREMPAAGFNCAAPFRERLWSAARLR